MMFAELEVCRLFIWYHLQERLDVGIIEAMSSYKIAVIARSTTDCQNRLQKFHNWSSSIQYILSLFSTESFLSSLNSFISSIS